MKTTPQALYWLARIFARSLFTSFRYDGMTKAETIQSDVRLAKYYFRAAK